MRPKNSVEAHRLLYRITYDCDRDRFHGGCHGRHSSPSDARFGPSTLVCAVALCAVRPPVPPPLTALAGQVAFHFTPQSRHHVVRMVLGDLFQALIGFFLINHRDRRRRQAW